ncbi:hypothetical protein [Paenibacillus cremeus]|nr:hypothetical protein [Paenibacillus cremeus]
MNSQIENNFKYHPTKDGQPQTYENIRNKAKEFAYIGTGCILGECFNR